MHVGKNKVTATMFVTIRKASNIASDSLSDNRNTVFVKWERASSGVSAKKKKEGTTKRALITNNEAIWEEKLAIKCTFYQSAKTQQWDAKHIYFTLKEDQVTAKGRNKSGDTGTKEKALGKWKIDLADYVKSDGADPVIFPMTAKKRSSSHKKSSSSSSLPMTLTLLFECKWSKFNNKKLVKMDDTDSENYKKEVIQIEGEEYYLEPAMVDSDDDDITETATEPTDEDDDDDESVNFEADDQDTPSSSSTTSKNPMSPSSSSSSPKSSGGTLRGDPRAATNSSSSSSSQHASNLPPPLPPKDSRYHDANNKTDAAPKSNRDTPSSSSSSSSSSNDTGSRKPQTSTSGSNLAGGYLSMKDTSSSSTAYSSALSNDLADRYAQLEKQLLLKDERIRQLEEQLKESNTDNLSASQAKGLKQQYDQLLKDQRMKADLIARQEREIEDLKKTLQLQASSTPSSTSSTGVASTGAGTLPSSSSPSSSSSSSSSAPSPFPSLPDPALAIAQDLEEINLVESTIYLKEPSFTERFSSAAVGLYDALVSFRAFDNPPRTRLLTHILRAITVSCKKSENDPNLLCYWLNSISSLLYFFSKANNTSTPALSEFVSGLQMAIPSIFSLLLVKVSKELSHKAVSAILEQQPTLFLAKKTFVPRYNVLSIIDILDDIYLVMEVNFIPRNLVEQFFEHVFYSINTVVFNALLKRKNLCSCGHGFQIKLEISVLEEWVSNHSLHVASSQLEHLVEAANLLVMDKRALGDWAALHKAFPVLTSQQILQILTSFVPDELNQTVTPTEILHFLSADVTIGDEDSICLWFYPEGPLKIDLSKLFADFQQQ